MKASDVGIVVIGRNEGTRLLDCLASLGDLVRRTVYVDSGSTDGSQANAALAGAQIVNLSRAIPFTAARARNAGVETLLQLWPDLHFVQFIDGDCTLDPAWIGAAKAILLEKPEIALVCGRRREKHPSHSTYNAMCDREWDGPLGPILECGGDFLVRVDRFRAVGGFRSSLIAGEEPELCLRLREQNWQIWRLPREMTLHDANILHFRQWWQRSVRAGHAFAEVSLLHRRSPRRIWRRNTVRALAWAALAPTAILGALVSPWFGALLLAYPASFIRQAIRSGSSRSPNWRDPAFFMLAKFAETQGILKYHFLRLARRPSALIEYK
ncbi:glycosyltransferase family 2 protein [Devosia submarina]|uniref:glycosyltransferase family 2 protein n=1 Tax=Devosia submarina TaxID=1173082 RepID=UPI000D3AFD97|nr:glycosyltransferase [Devosia submarina]